MQDRVGRCLDSLLTQTFRDFEIVVVDDGSTDGSAKVCDEYARRDPRVHVIHKQNGGVSAARQTGLDAAKGDYVIHADPDDWTDPTMLEELYAKAQAEDADMVLCDFYVETLSGQQYEKQQPSSLDHYTVQRELFQQLHGSCWNKLVKRACYNTYGVRFPVGVNFCEDEYTNMALLCNPLRIAYVPKAFYHYVRTLSDSALSRTYNEHSYEVDTHIRDLYARLLKDTPNADIAYESKTQTIIGRAFFFGAQYYSNAAFRRRFHTYRRAAWQCADRLSFRILMVLACMGMYHPLIDLLNFVLRMKSFKFWSFKF